jgi:hypothetical protein
MKMTSLFFALAAALVLAGCGGSPATPANACAPGVMHAGCYCTSSAPCGAELLCRNNACEVDTGQNLTPPVNPICYTPCRGGYHQPDGTYVACDADGLLLGCIDGATCTKGTCVPAAASRASTSSADGGAPDAQPAAKPVDLSSLGKCDSDDDCPLFQTCLDHACYSDCATDADCHGGRVCYMKSCRVPCTTAASSATTSACPAGESCTSQDGTAGYCLPTGPPAPAPATPDPRADSTVETDFTVSTSVVTFTPGTTTATITLTNGTPQARAVTVSKLNETEVKNDAPVVTTDSPLPWLQMLAGDGTPTAVEALNFTVPGNGGTTVIHLAGALNKSIARWSGQLQIASAGRPSRIVNLTFDADPEGQWTGRAVYYANFGTRSLDLWAADKTNQTKLNLVGNAFVQKWGAFRAGRVSWDEMKAVMSATQTASWRWASVQQQCPSPDAPNPNAACYLYDNAAGLSVYSDFIPNSPVPTGETDYPVVFNLHAGASPTQWTGRVVSSEALQYPGDPAVSMTFESDPTTCAGALCTTGISAFSFDTYVGGRYVTTPEDASCFGSVAYAHTVIPWLPAGFLDNTTADASGLNYRHECRDTTLPYGTTAGQSSLNGSLAGGNPIADGSSRHRQISLLDGVMVNQDTIVLLFKETFPSFLGASDTAGFASYGVMTLSRSQAVPQAADYAGVAASDPRPPVGLPGPGCTTDLLSKLQPGLALTQATAANIALGVLQGTLPQAPAQALTGASGEIVHYYCAATNLFDGGPGDSGLANTTKVACPAGSAVRYFTLTGATASQAAVAAMPCQRATCDPSAAGSCGCGAVLQSWIDTSDAAVRLDPLWQCTDPTATSCDIDPTNLRAGKTFFAAVVTPGQAFPSLDAELVTGFRYAENFQATSGAQVGFAPTVCLDGGTSTPFCYDPTAIEDLKARVDCAVDVAARFPTALAANPAAAASVKRALTKAFAYEQEIVPNLDTPLIHRGFEELNADLLVMLGDEAFTAALSSRFDLDLTSLASFEGSKLEPGGIDLDGSAGFEMFKLYQAVQYHQLALEEFYGLAPRLWTSLKTGPAGQSFVTPASAVSYFERLVAASSKKVAAWSEIGKQYESFNRPDLARLVIERAYGAAELESSILTRMMLGLVDVPSSPYAAEIQAAVEQAQAVAGAALADMAEQYADISSSQTLFGFPADYVPFPVLTPPETDVFQKAMSVAMDKLDIAKDKETAALADSRTFSTDSAMFQQQLVTVTQDYENQLGTLCGTFATTDAAGLPHVYPAIKKYAPLSAPTAKMGDPCGLVGNGDLWTAGQTLESDLAGLRAMEQSRDNLLASAQDAEARTQAQCARIQSLADFKLQAADQVLTLQDSINGINTTVQVLENLEQRAETLGQLYKCSVGTSTDCPTAAIASTTYIAISAVVTAGITDAQLSTIALQHNIQDIDNGVMEQDVLTECTAAEIDVQYTVRDLMRQAAQLQLQMAQQLIQFKSDAGQITKDVNQATLLQQQENDSTQLAINVEAAQNDPNVRVYRNIAVIEADRTFNDALQNAYRATRVFEYFTSQSYAHLGDLFLVRMVSSGDLTLESYLAGLGEAYIEFQQQFGQPDTRVVTLSLKDDLLAIPKLGPQGQALSLADRNAQFYARLQSPDLLDGNGYLTIPFSTDLTAVSPLTSNHQIAYVEAEFIGSDLGDTQGRVYVRQKGTGTIRPLAGDNAYYSFAPRTAVVDGFFNGTKYFTPDIYQNTRLDQMPFANTAWELVLNQKDETVNKDISLAGLSDIRLYLYYTDFTGN